MRSVRHRRSTDPRRTRVQRETLKTFYFEMIRDDWAIAQSIPGEKGVMKVFDIPLGTIVIWFSSEYGGYRLYLIQASGRSIQAPKVYWRKEVDALKDFLGYLMGI